MRSAHNRPQAATLVGVGVSLVAWALSLLSIPRYAVWTVLGVGLVILVSGLVGWWHPARSNGGDSRDTGPRDARRAAYEGIEISVDRKYREMLHGHFQVTQWFAQDFNYHREPGPPEGFEGQDEFGGRKAALRQYGSKEVKELFCGFLDAYRRFGEELHTEGLTGTDHWNAAGGGERLRAIFLEAQNFRNKLLAQIESETGEEFSYPPNAGETSSERRLAYQQIQLAIRSKLRLIMVDGPIASWFWDFRDEDWAEIRDAPICDHEQVANARDAVRAHGEQLVIKLVDEVFQLFTKFEHAKFSADMSEMAHHDDAVREYATEMRDLALAAYGLWHQIRGAISGVSTGN